MLSETLHAFGMPSSEYLLFVKQAVWVLKARFPAKNQRTQRKPMYFVNSNGEFVKKCHNLIFKVNVKNHSISFFQFRICSRLGQHFLEMPNF